MKYDFDKVIDRHNTGSVKWDAWEPLGKEKDVIPFWIADMDFPAPKPVIDAIKKRADHGIFGYAKTPAGYREAVINWYKTYFNWEPKREWLLFTPGIVFALGTAIKTFTEKGDGVLIQRPVYYPFTNMIVENGRKVVNSPLNYKDGKYAMDFVDFEKKVVEEHVKLFILCSPHNPVGRVWTKEELEAVGDICVKHGVTVVADEIHGDFVYPGHKHTPFSAVKPEFADISVVCTAPSKTFNIAGLQVSHIWIANEEKRKAFKAALSATGYDEPSIFGMTAAMAAYEEGREWLEQVLPYLRENYEFTVDYLKKELPLVSCPELQGTYLLWLDCSKLPYSTEERQKRIEKAKLWFDTGAMFGPEGEAFERINLACPRSILEEALSRLVNCLRP